MKTLIVARHELKLLFRDRRLWGAGVCVFVLLIAALVSSRQMRSSYESLRSEAQQASHR